MAESTLSVNYASLQAQVGNYLAFGSDPSKWINRFAERAVIVARAVESGLRQFLFPPRVPGEEAYAWRFTQLSGDLLTQSPYSTGTIAVTNGDATVTITGGSWPSWAANGALCVVGSGFPPLEIASRTNGSEIELVGPYQGDTATGLTFKLAQWTYDLPDAFGGFMGPLTYGDRSSAPPIQYTDLTSIRRFRQAYGPTTGTPVRFALRPSDTPPGTTGQRFVLEFDRAPDAQYVLAYRYVILPDAITGNQYPYGGMVHAETILASCLCAAAEQNGRPDAQAKRRYFLERLDASIEFDARQGPDTLGYCGDRSDQAFDPLPAAEWTAPPQFVINT